MKYLVALVAALAVAGIAAAAGAQPEPYDSGLVNYPWRNGAIQGPGGGYGGWGDGGGYNGYPGGPVPVNGGYGGGGYGGYGGGYYPGYGYGTGGYGVPQIFPLPGGGGGFSVIQAQDGSLQVTRFGPVWSSQLAPNGAAGRQYYNYGGAGGGFWSFLSSIWPFWSARGGGTAPVRVRPGGRAGGGERPPSACRSPARGRRGRTTEGRSRPARG
jgi:hypothetical protein